MRRAETKTHSALCRHEQCGRYPTVEHLANADNFKNVAANAPGDASIREELGFLECIDPHTCSPASLITWLGYLEKIASKENAVILALRTTDAFKIAKMSLLLEDESMEGSTITSDEVRDVVRLYESFATKWSNKALSSAVFDAEQRSRQLVVKWIAFCLIHQNVCRSHRLGRDYGIALSWGNLRVAVLRDNAAISALGKTASFQECRDHRRSTISAYKRAWTNGDGTKGHVLITLGPGAYSESNQVTWESPSKSIEE
ncbi:hypothetical protein Gpo141_00010979 [Globisporangium polare]